MRTILVSMLILLSLAGSRAGDKTELRWRSFDEGTIEAKQKHKKILLDVFTDWCGWCKKLDRDVYSDKDVSAYINQVYVPVKLNAESGKALTYRNTQSSEQGLANTLGVRSYPTIFFLDSEGAPINALGGYVDAPKFLTIIKYIGSDRYKTTKWEDYSKETAAQQK